MIESYDNHALSTWRSCPLKGWYRHVEHLSHASTHLDPPLEFGTNIHKALDVMYATNSLEKSLEEWMAVYPPVFDQYDPHDYRTDKHSITVGSDMLAAYWNYWAERIVAMDLIACERYFAMDLGMDDEQRCPNCHGPSTTHQHAQRPAQHPCVYCNDTGAYRGPFYCGVIDKVFRDQRTGQIVGMDHKTTSMLTSAKINAFKISQQFRGYVYWLMRKSPWSQTDDCGEYFYFDLLLKTRTTKYSDSGEPFFRDTVLTQKAFLDEWWDDMIAHVREIRAAKERYLETNLRPRQNSDACDSFNRLCGFYDLCSMPRPLRPTIVADVYEINPWNPLERP